MRWLVPPPAATAAFSSARSPGVVLRVSRIRAPVPATASTYRAVSVAIPGQPLQEVQRGPLGGQDRPRGALDLQHRPALAPLPLRGEALERDRRIERAERLLGDVEAEHDPGRLLRDQRPRASVLGHGRGGRHVAVADVLGERSRDDVGDRGLTHRLHKIITSTLSGSCRVWFRSQF